MPVPSPLSRTPQSSWSRLLTTICLAIKLYDPRPPLFPGMHRLQANRYDRKSLSAVKLDAPPTTFHIYCKKNQQIRHCILVITFKKLYSIPNYSKQFEHFCMENNDNIEGMTSHRQFPQRWGRFSAKRVCGSGASVLRRVLLRHTALASNIQLAPDPDARTTWRRTCAHV